MAQPSNTSQPHGIQNNGKNASELAEPFRAEATAFLLHETVRQRERSTSRHCSRNESVVCKRSGIENESLEWPKEPRFNAKTLVRLGCVDALALASPQRRCDRDAVDVDGKEIMVAVPDSTLGNECTCWCSAVID